MRTQPHRSRKEEQRSPCLPLAAEWSPCAESVQLVMGLRNPRVCHRSLCFSVRLGWASSLSRL